MIPFTFFSIHMFVVYTISCIHSIIVFHTYILLKEHSFKLSHFSLFSGTFEAKFLLLKLRYNAHFNVCTCTMCNLNVRSIMSTCSGKVESVLLAGSVWFLCPAMLNSSRNSDRNKTSICYKVIIQYWRLSIAYQGNSNIDKKHVWNFEYRSSL